MSHTKYEVRPWIIDNFHKEQWDLNAHPYLTIKGG